MFLSAGVGRLHDETWAGRDGNFSLPISQAIEIVPGCADTMSCFPPPFFASVSAGPGREVRNGIGWTARTGVWGLRGALAGSSAFFALSAAVDWVMKGSFLTAWSVPQLSSCSCSYAVWAGHGRRAPNWGAVLVTASWAVEDYRSRGVLRERCPLLRG